MTQTYEAVYENGVFRPVRDLPVTLVEGQHVRVMVDEPIRSEMSQGQRMAAALEKVAESQGLAGMDAAQWEREVRADKPSAHESLERMTELEK